MNATATKSLDVAHELRTNGFNSLLEAQPHVRDAYILLWQKGYSLRESRQELVKQFPEDRIPSVKALSNYVKHVLKHSTMDSRSPEYVRLATKYDSVRNFYRIANEVGNRYKFAVEAKCSFRTTNNLLKMLMDANQKVFDMELKLGMRQPAPVTDDLTSNATHTQQSEEYPAKTLEDSIELLDSWNAFQAKVTAVQEGPPLAKGY